jgi:hypothetical protein
MPQSNACSGSQPHPPCGFTDAGAFGFSPDAPGPDNTQALQRAVDQGGTIVVSRPGIYAVAGTVFIGSNTSLLVVNSVPKKVVTLKTSASVEMSDTFSATVVPGDGTIAVESDLTGLNGTPAANRGHHA